MQISRRHLFPIAALASALAAVPVAFSQWRSRRIAENGPPLGKDDFEQRALNVLKDIRENQSYLNVTEEDGRLLRVFTESARVRNAVEIGTSTGISGIWLGLGLRASNGKLKTFEIDKGRAETARANFRRAGLDDRIEVIVGDAHAEVRKLKEPLDLVFLDADKEGYVDYLNVLLPLVRPGGLIIADNMRVPSPDPRYVRAITTDPKLETLFLNMHAKGIGVTLKKG